MSAFFWHNPRCSKSRQALAIVEETGMELDIRHYLDDPPSLDELKEVHELLGIDAHDMLRTKEKPYKELGLSKDDPAPVLLAAMANHPVLIERPILITEEKAVIGRPPERVKEIL